MAAWLQTLFGRAEGAGKETKSSKTGALVAFHGTGQPVWTPRDTRALAKAGYERNPIAHRCIRLLAETAGSVSWLAFEGETELDTHPLLDLICQPNAHQDGSTFLQTVISQLMVAGNAYMECVSIDGAPREVHTLRPDRMKIIAGQDGWPSGFEYTVGAQKVRFDQEVDPPPILHLKLFHPTDDHYGLSPLEAAGTALDLHNAASTWNKALLDNAARPSGALVYNAEGHLSRTQYERLKDELEDSFQGAVNAGRPLLLEGGLDWKAIALSPKDMDFLEAKNAAAREIALAFGVPPMLLGIPGDNTFANYAEANRALWRETVLPLVGRVAKAVSGWLGATYGPDLRLWYDVDAIPALSSEREALWARLNAAEFLTHDEKRIAAGYGVLDRGQSDAS
jgi:HK97 family phage portal protein